MIASGKWPAARPRMQPPGQTGTYYDEGETYAASVRAMFTCMSFCPSFVQSIFQYAPTSRGAEDYASLAAELSGLAAAEMWAGPDEEPAGEKGESADAASAA